MFRSRLVADYERLIESLRNRIADLEASSLERDRFFSEERDKWSTERKELVDRLLAKESPGAIREFRRTPMVPFEVAAGRARPYRTTMPSPTYSPIPGIPSLARTEKEAAESLSKEGEADDVVTG